jgi:hypothetical protein
LAKENDVIGSQQRLGIRRGEVAAKVIDGEAILINLSTGLYYSMGKVGGRVWSLIEQNCSSADIASAIAAEYDVAAAAAASDVGELVAQLAAEKLIDAGPAEGVQRVAPAKGVAKAVYTKPELRKFSDMAEIFAMDPPLPGLAK